jgi:hypothetical protein
MAVRPWPATRGWRRFFADDPAISRRFNACGDGSLARARQSCSRLRLHVGGRQVSTDRGRSVRLQILKTFAAAAAAALGLAASQASAAQILLTADMLKGQYGTAAGSNGLNALDEQTGGVLANGPLYSVGSYGGTLVFDLGREYDFGRIDVFSFLGAGVQLLGGTNLFYDGYGQYYLNGGDVIASGEVAAGSIDRMGQLSAQSFAATTAKKYRYISFGATTPYQSIDEIRLFDREGVVAGAVPEPATWAMMIMGFAGMGAALRRRRQTAGLEFA